MFALSSILGEKWIKAVSLTPICFKVYGQAQMEKAAFTPDLLLFIHLVDSSAALKRQLMILKFLESFDIYFVDNCCKDNVRKERRGMRWSRGQERVQP